MTTLQSAGQQLPAAAVSKQGELGESDSITFSAATLDGRPLTDGWDLKIVWELQETDRSFVLGRWAGPEA